MDAQRRTKIFGALAGVLAALATLFGVLAGDDGGDGVQPKLPTYGQVPQSDNKLEKQVDQAQEAAVEGVKGKPGCELTEAEAKERSGDGTDALDHDMGDCSVPPSENKASVQFRPSSIGCDRSNNNPKYGIGTWKSIAAHGITYCWFKTSEGSTYRDRTVATMSRDARDGGVAPGGYHFAHVCLTSPHAEAALFISQLRAARLDRGPLRPALDVEYGGCSTQLGTRLWIKALYDDVTRALGIPPILLVYTGGWWSNPHAGCLFCALPATTVSWISGYPQAAAIPGRRCNQVHQYTSSGDHGLDGDINRLECGMRYEELFLKAVRTAPKEAGHQCRMFRYYAKQRTKFKDRKRKRGELHEYGTAKLKSAEDHVRRGRRYFVKNHEHGKVNYDCLSDGSVKVREV